MAKIWRGCCTYDLRQNIMRFRSFFQLETRPLGYPQPPTDVLAPTVGMNLG
jgi:hypothetical protein